MPGFLVLRGAGVYLKYMGLFGLLVTLGIMVLGAGYYFFSVSHSTMNFTNSHSVPETSGLGRYEQLKSEANTIKDTAENRAQEEMAVLEIETETSKIADVEAIPEKVEGGPAISRRLMNSGFSVSKKSRTIDTIVLHSSYNPNGSDPYSVEKIVQIYEGYGVSAHYLIARDGTIYQLVEDQNIAYHAGVSKMPDGRKGVNDFSIGIEIMNKEDANFTKAQYEAVNALVSFFKKKYGIKSVVGHSDIAPDRKTDPWNFDWKQLH